MIARTLSALPQGFDSSLIEVEGDKSQGLPAFNIVGIAKRTVSESRERVRSALKSSGFSFPDDKITINLAPADIEKEGTSLDLPIAINILILSGQLRKEDVKDAAFSGELSLDGSLRPIRGIVNIAEAVKKAGISTLFLPAQNLAQARLISGINLIGVNNLFQLFLHLKHQQVIKNPKNVVKNTETDTYSSSFDDIRGQSLAKRALTIAIAGHHNILLSGPPGTGKTALAKAALSLMPPLSEPEQISVTKLHSLLSPTKIAVSRPFRSPHHTCSLTSLVGGGINASPGEISLAHLGVLFLDELPEFPRQHLEALRQPLEDRQISISRINYKYTYPADFTLIATMNPCPCGYLGDATHPCSCTEYQIRNYQKKISGPLLDRIDLFVDVNRIKTSDLLQSPSEKTTPITQAQATPISKKAATKNGFLSVQNVVKNTITDAISAQHARYGDDITYNASLTSHAIATKISLSATAKSFLDQAASSLDLSARSYFKVIKVARTIADLNGSEKISKSHIMEALSFRRKNEKPLEFSRIV